MSYSKTKIYDLALSALLLSDEVIDITTDTTNHVRVFNKFWDVAFESTLQDLDLDSTSTTVSLGLLATLDDHPHWKYVYKYPTNCVFFRRIESSVILDRKSTHIPKRVGMYEGQKAIYTNEYAAVAEFIPNDVPIEALSAMSVLCFSYKLASVSAPLNVGKGAKKLREAIDREYVISKIEAQETDRLENFNFENPEDRSEWVEERLS